MRLRSLPLPGSLRSGRLLVAAAGSLLSLPAGAQEPASEALPPLTGAIYFDAWQLEKEIVASPLILQQWIDLGLEEDSMLDKDRRDSLKPVIGEFLGKRCPVLINGEEVDFTLDRIHFIEPNDKEFVLIAEDAVVPVGDVRVSAVFAAPNTNPQAPLQLLWNLFPDGVEKVPVTAADVAGSRIFHVRKGTPTVSALGRYEFGAREAPTAPPAPAPATLRIPWLTILLILCAVPVIIRLVRSEKPHAVTLVLLLALAGGAAAARKFAVFPVTHPFKKSDDLGEDRAREILDRLLRGVYHAFDHSDRDAQYAALAKVIDGDALNTIFLEIRRTLESRQRDGARVRVKDVRIEEASPTPLDDRRGFVAECAWEASGRVGHWGHFHDRTNRYRARFVVEPIGETWKITDLSLEARDRERPVDPAP